MVAPHSTSQANQTNIPALFIPCHSLALDLGWPGPVKRLDLEMQNQPSHPGGSAYSSSTPDHTARILTTASLHSDPKPKNCPDPLTPHHNTVLDLSQSQPRKRNNCGLPLRGAADACTDIASNLCKHMSPTCVSMPHLWGKDPRRDRSKNTFGENRTSSCLTLRVSTPAM